MLTNIVTKIHVKYLIIILSDVCYSILYLMSVYILNALNYNFIITNTWLQITNYIKAAYILFCNNACQDSSLHIFHYEIMHKYVLKFYLSG